MHRFIHTLLVCVSFSATLILHVSCQRGELEGTTYQKPSLSYRIAEPPAGWNRLDIDDNDLAWEHARAGAAIQINGSCDPRHDIPLKALTDHLLIGFTERSVMKREREPLDGREALRTHMVAKLDGVPRQLMLVVMKKNGCAYDFALVGPLGTAFDHVKKDFDGMLKGFHHIRAEG